MATAFNLKLGDELGALAGFPSLVCRDFFFSYLHHNHLFASQLSHDTNGFSPPQPFLPGFSEFSIAGQKRRNYSERLDNVMESLGDRKGLFQARLRGLAELRLGDGAESQAGDGQHHLDSVSSISILIRTDCHKVLTERLTCFLLPFLFWSVPSTAPQWTFEVIRPVKALGHLVATFIFKGTVTHSVCLWRASQGPGRG